MLYNGCILFYCKIVNSLKCRILLAAISVFHPCNVLPIINVKQCIMLSHHQFYITFILINNKFIYFLVTSFILFLSLLNLGH